MFIWNSNIWEMNHSQRIHLGAPCKSLIDETCSRSVSDMEVLRMPIKYSEKIIVA